MEVEIANELPQREMDSEAIEIFKDFMWNLRAVNDNDIVTCWLWPSVKNWPPDLKPLPKGYSASITGSGYGQFVLLKAPGSSKQNSPRAHILSYRYFNLKLDPEFLTGNKYDGAEWLGKYFETKTIKVESIDKDGKPISTILTLKRVIRHDAKCPKHCVNPYHLTIGDDWQNVVWDEALKEAAGAGHDTVLSQAAADCAQSIVDDFNNGEMNPRVLMSKYGISEIELVNIYKVCGLPTSVLSHNFNPQGHVDHKPKP